MLQKYVPFFCPKVPYGPYYVIFNSTVHCVLEIINIVYVIESAAYGVVFTSCLYENPNERGTSE